MRAGRRTPAAATIYAVALLAAAASLAALSVAAVPDASAQQSMACSEGFVSIMKNDAAGSMACVSPNTKAVLIERGWGSEPTAAAIASTAMSDAATGSGAAEAGAGDMPPEAGDVSVSSDPIDAEQGMGEEILSEGVGMPTADEMGMSMPGGATAGGAPQVDLTDAERTRLSGDGLPIRVAYDPLRLPIEFYDDETGLLGGISDFYMNILEASLRADFEPVDMSAVVAAGGPLEAVRTGAADVVLAADGDAEAPDVSFTTPHTTMPIVMVTTTEGRTVDATMLSGMNLGAVSGYGAALWLDDQLPGQYTQYQTAEEAVAALRDGEIEVFVGLWPVASYWSMAAEVDVYNAGETGQTENLSVAYAMSDADLGTALEKALAAVPPDFKAMLEQTMSDPVGILFEMVAEAGREGGVDIAGMGDEIDRINRAEDEITTKLLALPEAVAFKAQYTGYDSLFEDSGYYEATLTLTSANQDASLMMNYLKETEVTTFIYMCTDTDGILQSHHSDDAGAGMPDIISGPCTSPDIG